MKCVDMFFKNKDLTKLRFQGEAGSVFRGMLTLVIGSGLARIVGIASIPVLTRLYSPEDYGILAIYTSIVAVLVPILTLRYVTAIPLPKTDAMAFNLLILCAKLIIFGTLLISLVLAFFGEAVLSWFSMAELAPYWWLIAIGVFGTATYELFSMWATRKKDYKVIAKTQFGQSLLGNIVKIGLGLLAIKPLGLVFGQIIAQSGGIGSFIKNAFKDFKASWSSLSNKKRKILASYYQDFPKYRLPSQFLMVLSTQAPVLMMAALYDKEVTGQLSLAIMALALPVSLVGGAVSKAYYAEIASIGKTDVEKIKRITISTQTKLFTLSLPVTAVFMIVAKPLFSISFGKEWAVAGIYAAILAPFILLQFTSSPLVQVINILGNQLHFLAINIIRIVGLFFIYIFVLKYSITPENFVVATSVFLFLFYFGVSAFIFKILGSSK